MTCEEIKIKILPVLQRYAVTKAAIFGSVARGEETGQSDIDILVDLPCDKCRSLLDFLGLKLELEEELGRSVDLVEYSAIKPLIKDYILREQVRVL
jgi:hypothetical protein